MSGSFAFFTPKGWVEPLNSFSTAKKNLNECAYDLDLGKDEINENGEEIFPSGLK